MQEKELKNSRLQGLLRLAAKRKIRLLLAGMAAIVGEAAGLVPYFVIYAVIMELTSTPLDQVSEMWVLKMVAIAFGSVVAKNLLLGISVLQAHIAAYNILCDIRLAIATKMRNFPMGFFNRKNTGQIKKIMGEDVEQLEIFLAHNIPDMMAAAGYMLVSSVVMFIVDWRMALACIIALPAGFILQAVLVGGSQAMMDKWFSQTEKMNNAMVEFIQGMPVIKAFSRSDSSYAKFSKSIEDCHELEEEWNRRWVLPTAFFALCLTANLIFIVPVGSYLYLEGMISLGKFVFFLLMGIGFGTPVWLLIQLGRSLEKQFEGQERIWDILNAPELPETDTPQKPGNSIKGENVSFGYTADTEVLHGVDFTVPKGHFIALVGPSGAGKTTLARLMPRFWDVTAGCITLGENDVRDIRLADLMDKFSLIFQQVYLFNDTVRNNLKMGRIDATDEEMIEAAKSAQCHDFIMELPHGYDTVIGERGARISGGEKQRLSIARALIKDSPILVLDEATAFIDPENEVLVQQAIDKIVADKTLIVIAHRLSTITAADEIWLLDHGQIVDRGTHEQLLSENSLYQHLWKTHISSRDWVLEADNV